MKFAMPMLACLLLAACSAEARPASPAPASSTAIPEDGRAGIPAQLLPAPLDPRPDCAMTQPTGGTPPGESGPVANAYVIDGLWVGLYYEGVTFEAGGPGFVGTDGSLSMKFWWWRPEAGAPLTIEGRRLDAPAPPLRTDIPHGYERQQFQSTGLIFPTQGCWEVTGRSGDAVLTFLTLVLVRP